MEKFKSWWRQGERRSLLAKAVLMGLLPILLCLVTCAAEGKGINDVYLPASEWNDELFYYKQVESIVNYGYPQGYFGFNESHALKLSFAAWSPVLVFPWIIWGLLFGWNMLSPIMCNIVLMTLTMVIFVCLVKPGWKQLGILTLLFSFYTPFVRYMLSGMPEVICFSMLISFYSVAVSCLRRETKGRLVWLFVLSGVMTLMRPYLLLFMLLPAFLLIRRSGWKGLAGAAAVFGAVLAGYALIKHYLGAEYFAPLFFTDWVTAFFEKGFFGGLHNLFGTLYWKGRDFLQHMGKGFTDGLASGAFFGGYVAMLAVLLYQSVSDFKAWRRRKDRELENGLIVEAHLCLSFIGMLFALLLMYKLTEGSKHLLTFMAAGIFIISLMKTRFYKKTVFLCAVFAFFYSYMAVEPYDYQVPYGNEQLQAQLEDWQQTFEGELELSEEKVPNYDNVVIWTFSDRTKQGTFNTKWQLLYGLPKGFGISCCYSDYVLENFDSLQSRYLAVVCDGEIDKRCAESGYTVVKRDKDMVVYARY